MHLLRLEKAWPAFAALPAAPLLDRFGPIIGRQIHELDRVAEFEHRLSEEFATRSDLSVFKIRSFDERDVALRSRGVFDQSKSRQFESLTAAIGQTATLLGKGIVVRDGPVASEPDRWGHFVQYPSADIALSKMEELGDYVSQIVNQSPVLAAVVILAGICNLHPLIDGNGRVARIWFNLMMSTGGHFAYLPIYELSQMSRGGYLLSLREAQYRGEWLPLIKLLVEFVVWSTENSSSR